MQRANEAIALLWKDAPHRLRCYVGTRDDDRHILIVEKRGRGLVEVAIESPGEAIRLAQELYEELVELKPRA